MTFTAGTINSGIRLVLFKIRGEDYVVKTGIDTYVQYHRTVSDLFKLKAALSKHGNPVTDRDRPYQLRPDQKAAIKYSECASERLAQWDRYVEKTIKRLKTYLHKHHGVDTSTCLDFDGSIIETLLEVGEENDGDRHVVIRTFAETSN